MSHGEDVSVGIRETVPRVRWLQQAQPLCTGPKRWIGRVMWELLTRTTTNSVHRGGECSNMQDLSSAILKRGRTNRRKAVFPHSLGLLCSRGYDFEDEEHATQLRSLIR